MLSEAAQYRDRLERLHQQNRVDGGSGFGLQLARDLLRWLRLPNTRNFWRYQPQDAPAVGQQDDRLRRTPDDRHAPTVQEPRGPWNMDPAPSEMTPHHILLLQASGLQTRPGVV